AVNCGLDSWVTEGHAGPTGPARLASLRRLLGTDPRMAGQETKELGSVN
ncbi:MAG TPA: ribosome small subunit-dependent GTPase A, partial [Arthrobacter sp.]|nr:ribosome small subunit-dependent GTPase A [Arthrobacter sp.]